MLTIAIQNHLGQQQLKCMNASLVMLNLYNMHSNQFPTNKPKKNYGLFSGNQKLLEGDYSLLTWKKNQLAIQGIRFLKIKPI